MSYPVLKQGSNNGEYRIILFTKPNEGVIVETDSQVMRVGFSGTFNESRYTDFYGTVRVNNEVFGDNSNDPEEQYGDE